MTDEQGAASHLINPDSQQKKGENPLLDSLSSLGSVRDVPDSIKWKTLYMMLVRITTVSMANSFQLLALVDSLHEKGVIDKNAVELAALKQGHELTSQILALSDELELEVYREARDLQIQEMKKGKAPADPTAGAR
jgi:hypothetical protein